MATRRQSNSETQTREASTGRKITAGQYSLLESDATWISNNLLNRYSHLRFETARRKKVKTVNNETVIDADGNAIEAVVTNPMSMQILVRNLVNYSLGMFKEMDNSVNADVAIEFDEFIESNSGAIVDTTAKSQSALLTVLTKSEESLTDTEKQLIELLAKINAQS